MVDAEQECLVVERIYRGRAGVGWKKLDRHGVGGDEKASRRCDSPGSFIEGKCHQYSARAGPIGEPGRWETTSESLSCIDGAMRGWYRVSRNQTA